MRIEEMKAYCIREIKAMKTYNPLLSVFCLILRDRGKSYTRLRTAWKKANLQQLKLFKEM